MRHPTLLRLQRHQEGCALPFFLLPSKADFHTRRVYLLLIRPRLLFLHFLSFHSPFDLLPLRGLFHQPIYSNPQSVALIILGVNFRNRCTPCPTLGEPSTSTSTLYGWLTYFSLAQVSVRPHIPISDNAPIMTSWGFVLLPRSRRFVED